MLTPLVHFVLSFNKQAASCLCCCVLAAFGGGVALSAFLLQPAQLQHAYRSQQDTSETQANAQYAYRSQQDTSETQAHAIEQQQQRQQQESISSEQLQQQLQEQAANSAEHDAASDAIGEDHAIEMRKPHVCSFALPSSVAFSSNCCAAVGMQSSPAMNV
jgi:hypothetical protein